MRSFQDSIEKMLWPEKRDRDPIIGDRVRDPERSVADPAEPDRPHHRHSYLRVPIGYLPDALRGLAGFTRSWFPWLFNENEDVQIGPIPKGTPVNLLANLRLLSDSTAVGARADQVRRVLELLKNTKAALHRLPSNATDEQAGAALLPLMNGPRQQHLPRLHRQSGPLLRHQGPERSRRCRTPTSAR